MPTNKSLSWHCLTIVPWTHPRLSIMKPVRGVFRWRSLWNGLQKNHSGAWAMACTRGQISRLKMFWQSQALVRAACVKCIEIISRPPLYLWIPVSVSICLMKSTCLLKKCATMRALNTLTPIFNYLCCCACLNLLQAIGFNWLMNRVLLEKSMQTLVTRKRRLFQ